MTTAPPLRRRLPRPGSRPAPVTLAGALLLALLAGVAVAAPVLLRADATRVDVAALQQGVTARHWLGTDSLGRDVLARVLVATRLSLELALLATALGAVAGVVLGALPSVLGRRAARWITALINLLVAFPGLLLALFLAVVIGIGARGAVIAIGLAFAPSFARLTETLAASAAGRDYVAAARVLGVGRARMLVRHILPNIAEPLIINTALAVGGALLSLSGLSFLGFGVQPPQYDWGEMLNEGLSRIYVNPAAALAPGAAVVIAGIAFSLCGDALARRFGLTPAFGRLGPATVRRPPRAATEPGQAGEPAAVLRAEHLSVTFPAAGGPVSPVAGVSLTLAAGDIVGIVGESGSGKSLTAAAIAGLVPFPGVAHAARLEVGGRDLQRLTAAERSQHLGRSVATVFQDPMAALNPALRIGRQLAEVPEVRYGARRRDALRAAVRQLEAVRIPGARQRARQYPHEFSGGMRQRAVIGMGLMADPAVILADEPTTALDVTVQRQILRLLRAVRDERGTAIVLISHDMAVIRELAERVLVMYAGRVVEELPVSSLPGGAVHPYTRALVASVPDLDAEPGRPLASIPGRPPDPASLPAGCAFAPRCPFAGEQCHAARPELAARGDGHRVACWHPDSAALPIRYPAGEVRR